MLPMKPLQLEKQPGCIQSALAILGDKWTGLIIRDLSECPARFSSLETSLAGISPRTLSQRLNKLEDEKIINKRLYCQHPPRHTYQLTKKGQELQAILVAMATWGTRHSVK